MKKLIIGFLLCIAQPLMADDIAVTIYVDADYRPFSFDENGNAKGMYVDILETAFSRLPGFAVSLRPVPWRRGKYIMENGQGLGLAPAFFHGHDWDYLYPYSHPFYTETIVSICTSETLNAPRPDWPRDYIGLEVANIAGFDGWGGSEFHDLARKNEIVYVEARGSREIILMLAKRHVDCIMMEEKAFEYSFRKLEQDGLYDPDKDAVLQKAAVIGSDPVYIGYSKPAILNNKYPFHFTFRQALDSEIYRMIKSGEIEKIMDAYQE